MIVPSANKFPPHSSNCEDCNGLGAFHDPDGEEWNCPCIDKPNEACAACKALANPEKRFDLREHLDALGEAYVSAAKDLEIVDEAVYKDGVVHLRLRPQAQMVKVEIVKVPEKAVSDDLESVTQAYEQGRRDERKLRTALLEQLLIRPEDITEQTRAAVNWHAGIGEHNAAIENALQLVRGDYDQVLGVGK